jgi:hypothetical protein
VVHVGAHALHLMIDGDDRSLTGLFHRSHERRGASIGHGHVDATVVVKLAVGFRFRRELSPLPVSLPRMDVGVFRSDVPQAVR